MRYKYNNITMLHLIVINCYDGIRTTKPHYFKMFDYLETLENFKTITFPEIGNKNENEMKNIFVEKFGKIPDNIIFVEHLTGLALLNIPKEIKINILIDDLHHQGTVKIQKVRGLAKVSRILSTYGYTFNKYYPHGVPVYWFPHSGTFDLGFNENPINKILISGRLNKDIYPFRQHIINLAKKNTFLQQLKVNCRYEIKSDSENLIYGKKYVEILNKYLACFTCDASSDRPYIVAKHFEILLSGSLLLAGNPNTKIYFEKLGFIDGTHYISATIGNIAEKIKFIENPDNKFTINKIRKNGYELAKQKHTYFQRANYLINILENNNNDNIIRYDDGINQSIYFMEKIN